VTEVRPIDLALLTGKHLRLQEGCAFLRAQAGHDAAQLHDAAAVAAFANHLEDACGAPQRMLIESLANEPNAGIDDRRAKWLCGVEMFAFDGMANGIGMNLHSQHRASVLTHGHKVCMTRNVLKLYRLGYDNKRPKWSKAR
jgi:hypothetical protein